MVSIQRKTRTNKIVHAIAYVDTFLLTDNIDNCQLREVFERASLLSSQEIVKIIQSIAKHDDVYGIETILYEMNQPEFEQYIRHKLDTFGRNLMVDE